MKKMVLTLVLPLILMTTVSCIGIRGSESPKNPPTLGQELIDLKKAKDSGSITYEEYKELKDKLKELYE